VHELEGYQHEVTLNNGRYAKQHIQSKKWWLFDRKDNVMAICQTIKEAENKAKELK
jgi:hypothetical protein